MRLRLLLVLGLAACGSAGAGTAPGRSTTTISIPASTPSGGGTSTVEVTTFHNAAGLRVAVAAPVDSVWAVLPDILASEGVPVEHVDQAGRVMGNRRLAVSRALGRRRLSMLLDCGTNPFGEPVADSYRVQLSVTTTVRAGDTAAASTVETAVSASGTAPGAAASAAVRCESKGVLENAINQAVAEHFAS